MLPTFSVLRWSPPKIVEPVEAGVAPTCAPVAEVTVPTAPGGDPVTGIRNKQYDNTTATTARARNIYPLPEGWIREYSPRRWVVNAIRIPFVRYFPLLPFYFLFYFWWCRVRAVTMISLQNGRLETDHGTHSTGSRQQGSCRSTRFVVRKNR